MRKLAPRCFVIVPCLFTITLFGCAATSEQPVGATDGGAADSTGGKPGSDSSVADSGPTADTGVTPVDTGSGTTDTGSTPSDTATADTSVVSDVSMPAPLIVDEFFAPSGYMGDGETPGPIAMIPAKPGDSKDCDGRRASSSAKGDCHQVTYSPPASGGKGWAGVYWQYPANNWGTKPGYAVAAGAKKVSFWAKGAKGGEKLTFLAGGIAAPGAAYQDSVSAKAEVTLTTEWAPYSIDIAGQTYTEVLGGFGWTMKGPDATPTGKFYVDDIRWE
jgi:hypothetical protein